MKKAYEAHEFVYRRMKEENISSWGERPGAGSPSDRRTIQADVRRFLTDVLVQPWVRRGGRVIELGCGTAPMLRWFCAKGFSGLGVDISKTAISMARSQSHGFKARFVWADVCSNVPAKSETFDIVLDGHCLHCITDEKDRQAFLLSARRRLGKGGVFIVLTMCAPLDRRVFSRCFQRQHLKGCTIYTACDGAEQYAGARQIQGRMCMPTRHVGHWKNILIELRRAGFRPRLFRYNAFAGKDPFGSLYVAALA